MEAWRQVAIVWLPACSVSSHDRGERAPQRVWARLEEQLRTVEYKTVQWGAAGTQRGQWGVSIPNTGHLAPPMTFLLFADDRERESQT